MPQCGRREIDSAVRCAAQVPTACVRCITFAAPPGQQFLRPLTCNLKTQPSLYSARFTAR